MRTIDVSAWTPNTVDWIRSSADRLSALLKRMRKSMPATTQPMLANTRPVQRRTSYLLNMVPWARGLIDSVPDEIGPVVSVFGNVLYQGEYGVADDLETWERIRWKRKRYIEAYAVVPNVEQAEKVPTTE